VIGGGLAGLASAVALAETGLEVRLLEKRPHLGGRATSYTLPDGSEVDNCQHVTLGCCTNLSDFYRRVGAEAKVRFFDRLYFADAQGRRSTIEAGWFPPPLHLAPSFVRFGALTLSDKRAIARAMLAIVRAGGEPSDIEGLSMRDWLERVRQTTGAVKRFWQVVLVSALNEELAGMDARYGIQVFWKSFSANRAGYRLGVPCVPLAELYEGCREGIVRRGGQVRLRCGVRAISVCDGRCTGATLEDGTEVSADACIAAVPHDAVLDMLPEEMAAAGGPLESVRRLRTSPITGVHLWFDRQVMMEPFLALLDHTTQWVFNKSLLYARGDAVGEPGHPGQETRRSGLARRGEQYLQLVISASHDLVPRSRQELIELCRGELADVLPATREAKLEKATVIKEVHATFSPEPGVDLWRPGQEIGVRNLFLAGDWTRTGWPATMEGAVRSGYLAAEAVVAALRPGATPVRKFVQPDLPVEGLSRCWTKNSEDKRASGADSVAR